MHNAMSYCTMQYHACPTQYHVFPRYVGYGLASLCEPTADFLGWRATRGHALGAVRPLLVVWKQRRSLFVPRDADAAAAPPLQARDGWLRPRRGRARRRRRATRDRRRVMKKSHDARRVRVASSFRKKRLSASELLAIRRVDGARCCPRARMSRSLHRTATRVTARSD